MRTADFAKILANFNLNVLVRKVLIWKKSTQNKSGRLIEEMWLKGDYHQYYHTLHWRSRYNFNRAVGPFVLPVNYIMISYSISTVTIGVNFSLQA